MVNAQTTRAVRVRSPHAITLPTAPGVYAHAVLGDDGKYRTAVSGRCDCGSVAFGPFQVPGNVYLEHALRAARMLLADTQARCHSGEDRAPACEEVAARKRTLVAVRAANRLGLRVIALLPFLLGTPLLPA